MGKDGKELINYNHSVDKSYARLILDHREFRNITGRGLLIQIFSLL